jgi:hypothetical protein
VKRRKFATAAVLFAALLVAAAAAASVSAAPSQSSATSGKYTLKESRTAKGVLGSFTGTGATHANAPAQKTLGTQTNKYGVPIDSIRGTMNNLVKPGSVHKGNGLTGGSAAGAAIAGPPVGPNLPFAGVGGALAKEGINAWLNDQVTGNSIEPDPSPAICQGPGTGRVIQITEDTLQIQDQSFTAIHAQNAEPLALFFLPVLPTEDFVLLDHPHCYYDTGTRHWVVAVDAFDVNEGASAVLMAVSVTSDPLAGPWYFYAQDTTNTGDGGTCDGDPCYGALRGIGANKNALVISTDQWEAFDIISHLPNQSTVFSTEGASIWAFDLTGMALGLAVSSVSANLGSVPPALGGPFWGVMPSQSPNSLWNFAHGGTEFLVSARDPGGSLDDTVFLFALTNTSTISFLNPSLNLSWAAVQGPTYGLPITDTDCSNVNLAYVVLNTITCADQPPYGLTPLGDFRGFQYGGIPRPINAGDDQVADAKSVTIPNGPATTTGFVLTTKVVVQDAIHQNHLRAGTFYGFLRPTHWIDDQTIDTATYVASGYISNANNSIIYPSLGYASNGTKAVVVGTLTGNAHFPSAVYTKVNIYHPVTTVNIAAEGQGPYDGFFQYPLIAVLPAPVVLFFGEYSSATADGSTVYFSQEYVQTANCTDAVFAGDPTCGGTRSWGENWSALLGRVSV